jgi:hypothetical protein
MIGAGFVKCALFAVRSIPRIRIAIVFRQCLPSMKMDDCADRWNVPLFTMNSEIKRQKMLSGQVVHP